ncbi:hypothetical protein [Rhodoblastus sp.]|uniref:hypothetical protein n=1 Tax=Rhodoblastus sp. TaxID=1962975 RepID=UPI003F9692A5
MRCFKLENRLLIRAREFAPRILQSQHYRRMHGLLQSLVETAAPGATAGEPGYVAHVLVAALHIDLIEQLLPADLRLRPFGARRPRTRARLSTALGAVRSFAPPQAVPISDLRNGD